MDLEARCNNMKKKKKHNSLIKSTICKWKDKKEIVQEIWNHGLATFIANKIEFKENHNT